MEVGKRVWRSLSVEMLLRSHLEHFGYSGDWDTCRALRRCRLDHWRPLSIPRHHHRRPLVTAPTVLPRSRRRPVHHPCSCSLDSTPCSCSLDYTPSTTIATNGLRRTPNSGKPNTLVSASTGGYGRALVALLFIWRLVLGVWIAFGSCFLGELVGFKEIHLGEFRMLLPRSAIMRCVRAALLNPSTTEPLVWPSPLKFISELKSRC